MLEWKTEGSKSVKFRGGLREEERQETGVRMLEPDGGAGELNN